jgi:hypothetical protein
LLKGTRVAVQGVSPSRQNETKMTR